MYKLYQGAKKMQYLLYPGSYNMVKIEVLKLREKESTQLLVESVYFCSNNLEPCSEGAGNSPQETSLQELKTD